MACDHKNEAAQGRLSLHLSNYHIVGNDKSWLIYDKYQRLVYRPICFITHYLSIKELTGCTGSYLIHTVLCVQSTPRR